MVRAFFFVLVVSLLAACPGPEVACRVGADCASGVCLRDGTCAAVMADGGATDSGTDAGSGAIDAGADAGVNDAGADAGIPVGCIPNHDGVIERSEVFFRAGLRATFVVSGQATFATAGAAQADGGRAWDFTPALPGDAARLVETRSMQGQWFESDFPDAGYYTELGGGDLLGVFQVTDSGLFLQGVVSATDGLFSTRVRYAPAVKVLQFPLRAGDSWMTQASVSGRYNGVVLGIQNETYQSSVDRAGEAKTPYATFPVLRVRTVMDRTINFVPTLTLRTYSWNTECFGTVATAQSRDNETSTELSSAAEVRRLSP